MSTAKKTPAKHKPRKTLSNPSGVTMRARILGGCFVTIGFLLIVQLYMVQVVHGASYAADAMGQYVEQNSDTESRGTIYFSTKDGALVAAATMQTGWRIAINPKEITNPTDAFTKINAVTPIDRTSFVTATSKKNSSYEEVAFRLDDATAQAVRKLKIPGVTIVQDQWRTYPAGTLASQVVGFIAFKGNSKTGVYGLERSWQDTLALSGDGTYVNPFAEIFTNAAAAVSSDPASHSGSVITTIEPAVQQKLEDTLADVEKTYHPTETGGIIMDPKTGEIIAMGAWPTFDPNTYGAVTDMGLFQNPLVERSYEMGSIMKPLTMAAGIDTGAVTTATTYNDTGCIVRSTKKVCNFDFKARGVIPVQEILNQSLNVGATFVEEQTGHKPFTDYVHAYGMGSTTGIDLPGEIAGNIASLGNGSGPDVNYATASFGQGIAVTPIEMIRALAVLADGGKLPNPHIVKAVQYETGITRAITVPPSVQIIKPTSADTVATMLSIVFDTSLLKGALKHDHYSFAAKTGTAQIADPHGGGYLPNTYLHSFFGFFPAHDPRFIVFLYAVRPQGVEYASASLAHPFMNIGDFLINYYNIPPDR